ncbi:hypothetical protein MC885_017870, partial [Smutsia gigantea]
ENPLQFRTAGLRTVGPASSLSEAWLRCGEGFQDTSESLSLTAEKKTHRKRDKEHGSKIDRFCDRNTLCPEDGASEDELQLIGRLTVTAKILMNAGNLKAARIVLWKYQTTLITWILDKMEDRLCRH